MPEKTAEMLRADLIRAGIPYEVGGKVADFHALRGSFITNLVRSGANIKAVQKLARHSTITLTMDTYTTIDDDEMRKATGGGLMRRISARRAASFLNSGFFLLPTHALLCAGQVITRITLKPTKNPFAVSGYGEGVRSISNASRRTRTFNPLIKSQLLCQLS